MTVRAGGDLQVLAAAGSVRLFVQDTVSREWNDNLPAARRDGEMGIRAFTATWQIAADLGQPAAPLPGPSRNSIDDLEQLSRNLLAVATVLDRDYAGMSWAIDCVAAKRKPSSAKGPVKDCHILGHALCLSLAGCRLSQLAGLVSSNRSDFAAPNANIFHPEIAHEAALAGLEYAVSLEAAVAALRATGDIP